MQRPKASRKTILMANKPACGVVAGLFLAACASDPPPPPPAELVPVSASVQFNRLWSANVGEAGRGLFEPFIDDGQILLANADGKVSSLATETGMRQWSRDLDVTLTSGVGGNGEQCFVSDTLAMVHAFDCRNGDTLWQVRASSEVTRPLVANSDTALMRSSDGRVVALESVDGTERWTISNPPPALSLNGYSRPYLVDGGLLLGLDDGRLLALNLNNGRLIWESVVSVPSGRSEVERLVDIDADLAADSEGIYVANYQGRAARLEPAKGQVTWSVPFSVGAGIVLDDTGLVVIDENDTVQKFDKQTGQLVWSNETMANRHLSAPALTPQGDILVGDVEGYLHVLSSNSGEAIGRTRLGRKPITARPLLRDNVAYVQTSDGLVAAFRFAR